MRRFEIRRLPAEPLTGQNPYVLVLQARGLEQMSSVIVAPLEQRARSRTLSEFELEIEIIDVAYIVVLQELASQPKREIGEVVGSAAHLEWEIGRAIDRLQFGV